MKVYQSLAHKVSAIRNCEKNGNADWLERHSIAALALVRDYLPSGSGFDCGTAFDIDDHVDSKRDELRFSTYFHHMSESGYYMGWTEHKIIVRPCLAFGFSIKVTGRDKNGIKEYIGDMFYSALNAPYQESN